MGKEVFWSFYFYIHSELKKKYNGNYVSIKEAKSFLFEWRIPKPLRPIILKELEKLGLIEREDRYTIKLKESKIDIENISQLYSLAGLLSPKN